MKICIFSGIFYPEIGGPATYAVNLVKGLKEKGHEVKVITYSQGKDKDFPTQVTRISKSSLKIISYINAFFQLLKLSKDSDIVYSFAVTTLAIPQFLASKLLRKKLIIRLGGDFLWERAVEAGRTNKSLKTYYYQEAKTLSEKLVLFILKTVLRGADMIIFSTEFQREIYLKYYNLNKIKTTVIENPFLEHGYYGQEMVVANQILYAGRLLKLKNLDNLIKIISDIDSSVSLKIIGQGPEKKNLELRIKNLGLEDRAFIENPISHKELMKEIQKSYLCILPSLTEISPNFILECIKLKKPVLVTKETGIFETFKKHLIFIDPQDNTDIREKLLFLLKPENYNNYLDKIGQISTDYTWSKNIEKHILLFKHIL
jgi:glycosyltransferase involved in cell wall biosynthesis